eukprot:scaffold394_cov166-Amphora_coffeaeformis.AAC.5
MAETPRRQLHRGTSIRGHSSADEDERGNTLTPPETCPLHSTPLEGALLFITKTIVPCIAQSD